MLQQQMNNIYSVASTNESEVATLSDLVRGLAMSTGLPEATVLAYGRFAREAGYISQKGRGRGAAGMTIRDAANLLIAIGGTAVTREAGNTIKRFRTLPAANWDVNNPEAVNLYKTWLTPLISSVVTETQAGPGMYHYRPSAADSGMEETWYHYPPHSAEQSPYPDFGRFVEFLIEQAMSGDLIRTFRNIAVVEIRHVSDLDSLEAWTTDELISERSCPAKPPEQKKFGVAGDIWMTIEFDRIKPRVHIEVKRKGLRTEVVFEFDYDRYRFYADHDLDVTACIGLNSVMVLGVLLSGKKIPKKVRTAEQLTTFLYNQPF